MSSKNKIVKKVSKKSLKKILKMKKYIEKNILESEHIIEDNKYTEKKLFEIAENDEKVFTTIEWEIGKYLYTQSDLIKIVRNHSKMNDSMLMTIGTQLMKQNFSKLSITFIKKYFLIYFSKHYEDESFFPLLMNTHYFVTFHKSLQKNASTDLEKKILSFIDTRLVIKYFLKYDNIINEVKTILATVTDKRNLFSIFTYFHSYQRYDFSWFSDKEKLELAKLFIENMDSLQTTYENDIYEIPNAAVNFIEKLLCKVNLSGKWHRFFPGPNKLKISTLNSFKKNVSIIPISELTLFYFLLEFSKHNYSESEVKEFIMYGIKYGSLPFLHLIKKITGDDFIYICYNSNVKKKSLIKYFEIDFNSFGELHCPKFFDELIVNFKGEDTDLFSYVLKKCSSNIINHEVSELKNISSSLSKEKRRLNFLAENNLTKYCFYDFNSCPEYYKKNLIEIMKAIIKNFIQENSHNYVEKTKVIKIFFKRAGLKILKLSNSSNISEE